MLAAPTGLLAVSLRPHLPVKLQDELLGLGIDLVITTVHIVGTIFVILVVIRISLDEVLQIDRRGITARAARGGRARR